MVLLTSSQVSVAISSFIIFFFTTALFFSGYVLQQQTLRDLRAAIKPQLVPTPPELKWSLPPQFRDDSDGRGAVDVEVKEAYPTDDGKAVNDGEDNMVGATRWQKEAARKKKNLANQKAQKPIGGENTDGKGQEADEKPLSRAERRKKIKEEILMAGEGESFKGYKRRMW